MNIFIFRRDFRLFDNSSLIKAVEYCQKTETPLLPLFIYNKDQIDPNKNEYFSNNAMQFLVESIKDLEKQLSDIDTKAKLHKFIIEKTEDEAQLIRKIHQQSKDRIINIFYNKDLTPFARSRDELIQKMCRDLKINVLTYEDYTLFPMQESRTKTNDGKPYRVFSFLYKKRKELHDLIPDLIDTKKLLSKKKITWYVLSTRGLDKTVKLLDEDDDKSFYEENKHISVRGGRKNASDILTYKIGRGSFSDYEKTRDDIFDDDGTTRLSAYLKFGCISIREFYTKVYEKHGIDHSLIRELYFREFYYGIAWFFPHVLEGMKTVFKNKSSSSKNQAFLKDVQLPWKKDAQGLKLWKEGMTGTPLVDAGMRQMNKIGFMHNRARMVVSMYLTKDLFIDWREGEKYFATKLVDYHPVQNNAGWQWSASIGTDAAPYFRVMNPYTQGKRFDKDAIYIKKWIPELKDVKPSDIHNWEDKKVRDKYTDVKYTSPYIEDHTKKTKEIIAIFKKHM